MGIFSRLDIEPEQKENLQKLLNYVKVHGVAENFDMMDYCNTNSCNTVRCLAGHGPLAGIIKSANESWTKYVDRCFTNNLTSLYVWLFDAEWSMVYGVDDEMEDRRLQLEAAIARLTWTLKHDVYYAGEAVSREEICQEIIKDPNFFPGYSFAESS